jgi:hypothetical protein
LSSTLRKYHVCQARAGAVSDRFFDFVGKTTRTRPWECSFRAIMVSNIEGENHRNIEYIAQLSDSKNREFIAPWNKDREISMSKCGVPDSFKDPQIHRRRTPEAGLQLVSAASFDAGFSRSCRARPTCGSYCCHRFPSFRLCSQPALRSLRCRQHAAYRLHPLMPVMRLL